jgi:multicomponent Na+:H+ antiporter subunit F
VTGIYLGAAFALVVAMLLMILRGLLGPSVYDRILSMNALGTKTVLFLALLGFIQGRPDFVDVALVYALINFVTTVAVLQLVERGRLG